MRTMTSSSTSTGAAASRAALALGLLVCGGINLIERIVREIASIGDCQSRLTENEAHTETVRKLAAEIAYQMRFAPVPSQ